jgi:transcriptional regulator with XRE-family HTH domain
MKPEQKLHAKNLFFGTGLTQEQIAEKVGVNRKTIRLWSQQDNWIRLRQAERHLPSMVAEKCYYMVDQFITSRLSENNNASNYSWKDADFVNKMASAIKKFKARSAINESMEMFNFFLEDVKRKDEKMAEAISPFIEDYFDNRANISIRDFQRSGFDEQGRRLWADEEKEIMEQWQDEKDDADILQAMVEARLEFQTHANAQHQSQSSNEEKEATSQHTVASSGNCAQAKPLPITSISCMPATGQVAEEVTLHSTREAVQKTAERTEITSLAGNETLTTALVTPNVPCPENGTFLGHSIVDNAIQNTDNQSSDHKNDPSLFLLVPWDMRDPGHRISAEQSGFIHARPPFRTLQQPFRPPDNYFIY